MVCPGLHGHSELGDRAHTGTRHSRLTSPSHSLQNRPAGNHHHQRPRRPMPHPSYPPKAPAEGPGWEKMRTRPCSDACASPPGAGDWLPSWSATSMCSASVGMCGDIAQASYGVDPSATLLPRRRERQPGHDALRRAEGRPCSRPVRTRPRCPTSTTSRSWASQSQLSLQE